MAVSGSLPSLSISVLTEIASTLDNLQRGQQAFQQFASESTASLNSVTASFKQMQDGIGDSIKSLAEIAGVAISLDSFKEAIAQTVELDVQIQHLSDTFGISVGAFSDLNAAAVLSDQSLGEVTSTMTRLERASAQAVSGSAKQVEAFNALNISVAQLKSLSPDELLQRVATELTETAPSAQRTADMIALFGRNVAGIYPILQQLAQGAHDASVAFGNVITPDQTARAEAFSQSIGHVHLAFGGLEQQFVSEVIPALTTMANQFAAMISTSSALSTSIAAIGTAADFLSQHLDGIVESAKTLIEIGLDVKIYGWTQAMYGLAIQAEGTAAAMYTVGTAAVGAVAIGAAAFTGWQVGEWARENFAWVAQVGQWIAAAAATIETALKAPFEAAFTAIKTLAEGVIAYIRTIIADGFQGIAQSMAGSINPIISQLAASFQTLSDSIRPAQTASETISKGFSEMTTTAKTAWASITDLWSSISTDSSKAAAGVEAMNAFKQVVIDIDAEAAHGHLTDEQATADKLKLADAFADLVHNGNATDAAYKMLAQTTAILGAATEQVGTKISTFVDNAKNGTASLESELAKFQEQLDTLAAKSAGPYDAANLQFLATMQRMDEEIVVMLGHGLTLAQAIDLDAKATDAATAAMWRNIAADVEKNDAIDTWYQKLINSTAQLGLMTNAEKAAADFDAVATKNLIDNRDAQGIWYDTAQEAIAANAKMRDGYIASGAALMDYGDQLKQNMELLKSWASTAQQDFDSAFSAINKDIIEGGSVMKDLTNIAKTVVEQILLEFEKLAIINPLLNSIFGLSGSAAFPTLGTAAGALNLAGGNGGLLGQGASWLNNLLGGGSSFDATSGLGVIGSSDALGLVPDYLGTGAEGVYGAELAGSSAGGGLLSSIGGIGGLTSIIGGAMAGYQIGGVTGAAALGVASYFVPVVGWIAGAASLINSLTGGGLFGTSWKAYGSEQDITVGGGGAVDQTLIDEKKKGSFFSGTKWKTVDTTTDPATVTALDNFFTSLQNAATQEALAYGQTTGQIVNGTFKETFDASGKLLTQMSTVAGQQFSESIQDFQNRILADTLLANMGDAAAEAQQIAQQWQSSASTLLAGAQFLAQAELDIKQGHALVQGDTLTMLTTFVQGMAAQGESLLQTYVRLSAEVTDVQGILNNLSLSTGKTGEALVKFDDEMVKAAGSLQNLNTLWNDYYTNFYSASEQSAITLKNLQTSVDSAFKAIGEDPTESMAKFRTDFENALPTLTADQVVQWLQAGEALAALNKQLGTTQTQADATTQAQADALVKYQQFVEGLAPANTTLTTFETSLDGLQSTLLSNINQANALAQAAGLSGASVGDLTNILQQSAVQGAAALSKLESDTASLAASLFGSNIDQLKAQLAALSGGGAESIQFQIQLQKQIDAAQAQADAAAHLSQATALLNDFAQIGAISGQSLGDLAKQFNVPLDQLSKMLGVNSDGLNKMFATDESIAKANLEIANNTKLTNELLQNIYDSFRGLPATFGPEDIAPYANPNLALPSAKPGVGVAPAPITAPEVVSAIANGTQQSTSDTDRLHAVLSSIDESLKVIRGQAGSNPPFGRRNNRLGILTLTP